MKPHIYANDPNYQRHLAKLKDPEFVEIRRRVESTFLAPSGERGPASDADLAAWAMWELREAMYWIEPAVSRADADGFHAGGCVMRANAALEILTRRSR